MRPPFECAPRLEMRMRAPRTVPLAGWADLSPTARAERFCSKWSVGGCSAEGWTCKFRTMPHQPSIDNDPVVALGTRLERAAGVSDRSCGFGESQAARTVACARPSRPSAGHVRIGFRDPRGTRSPPLRVRPRQTHHFASRGAVTGRGWARERADAPLGWARIREKAQPRRHAMPSRRSCARNSDQSKFICLRGILLGRGGGT